MSNKRIRVKQVLQKKLTALSGSRSKHANSNMKWTFRGENAPFFYFRALLTYYKLVT